MKPDGAILPLSAHADFAACELPLLPGRPRSQALEGRLSLVHANDQASSAAVTGDSGRIRTRRRDGSHGRQGTDAPAAPANCLLRLAGPLPQAASRPRPQGTPAGAAGIGCTLALPPWVALNLVVKNNKIKTTLKTDDINVLRTDDINVPIY